MKVAGRACKMLHPSRDNCWRAPCGNKTIWKVYSYILHFNSFVSLMARDEAKVQDVSHQQTLKLPSQGCRVGDSVLYSETIKGCQMIQVEEWEKVGIINGDDEYSWQTKRKQPFWRASNATVVRSLSCVRFFVTQWAAARQASLSTIFQSFLKLMYIESMMSSNHLILCCPLLLLPSIFPSIRVFSNELASPIRWPEYWSFSFSISSSDEYSGLISFRIDCFLSPCFPRDSRESSTTP